MAAVLSELELECSSSMLVFRDVLLANDGTGEYTKRRKTKKAERRNVEDGSTG